MWKWLHIQDLSCISFVPLQNLLLSNFRDWNNQAFTKRLKKMKTNAKAYVSHLGFDFIYLLSNNGSNAKLKDRQTMCRCVVPYLPLASRSIFFFLAQILW